MYFDPSFSYMTRPACKNASQICATLRLSEPATDSNFFFNSERTLKVSLVFFAVILRRILTFLAANRG